MWFVKNYFYINLSLISFCIVHYHKMPLKFHQKKKRCHLSSCEKNVIKSLLHRLILSLSLSINLLLQKNWKYFKGVGIWLGIFHVLKRVSMRVVLNVMKGGNSLLKFEQVKLGLAWAIMITETKSLVLHEDWFNLAFCLPI